MIPNNRSTELTKIARKFFDSKTIFLNNAKDITVHKNKQIILSYFHASEEDWNSWKWQIKNSIHTTEKLNEIFNLHLCIISKNYWAITPYFLSLIQEFNYSDPIFAQMIPNSLEKDDTWGTPDPMNEEITQPVKRLTRRYPDRVTINVTNSCFSYCRHCQRKRNISCHVNTITSNEFKNALHYIREHQEIRDVIITGGDPLILSNQELEIIIQSIRDIPHVEIIRIGTRALSTMPQRISKDLSIMLQKYSPIYINTQFNHPNEITVDTERACSVLSDHGIVLGNQSVLLKGVNDNSFTLQLLNQILLKNRIRPYYIFHPKTVKGTHHFYVSIDRGVEIVNQLRGNTSGLCIPTYIYNSPGGNGKIVLNKNNLKQKNGNKFVVTWEGKIIQVLDDNELK